MAGRSAFNRLGVLGGDRNGFPNGRRLQDDVVDIALQAVGGELKGIRTTWATASTRTAPRSWNVFPYLVLPHSGSVAQHSPKVSGVTVLTGGSGRAPSGGPPSGPLTAIGIGTLLARRRARLRAPTRRGAGRHR